MTSSDRVWCLKYDTIKHKLKTEPWWSLSWYERSEVKFNFRVIERKTRYEPLNFGFIINNLNIKNTNFNIFGWHNMKSILCSPTPIRKLQNRNKMSFILLWESSPRKPWYFCDIATSKSVRFLSVSLWDHTHWLRLLLFTRFPDTRFRWIIFVWLGLRINFRVISLLETLLIYSVYLKFAICFEWHRDVSVI